jgi:hypothetical protein
MPAATAPSYDDATAPKARVFFPRPSSDEMAELMTLLRNNELSMDDSIEFIRDHVPYRRIVKTSTFVVDTGNTFAANTPTNFIRSLWTQAPIAKRHFV